MSFTSYIHKNPFLLLIIPLVLGIVSSKIFTPNSFLFLGFSIITFVGVIICYFLRIKGAFLISASLFLFSLGYIRTVQPEIELIAGETYLLEGRCIKNINSRSIVFEGNGCNIYLIINDSCEINPGDSLRFYGRLYNITHKGNLHEFDYNSYLKNQNIHLKAFPTGDILVHGRSEDIYSICYSIRQHLLTKLEKIIPDSTVFSIISALCLGYRQDFPSDTMQLFQLTGTVHVLAISGLHMGIIFVLLSFLIKLFRFKTSYANLVLIPLLWFFVFISGLSPSACRAATILSFIIIRKSFEQDFSPINAICATAFFTLLVNPNLLYSVSFQMSYAAYTGIVLSPLTGYCKSIKNVSLRKLCILMSVSLAAQIATFPLTAYYFQVVNLNSVFINLFVIPIASIILYLGIALIVLPIGIGAILSYLVSFVTNALLFSLNIFNRITVKLSNVYPDTLQVILIYCMILFLIIYLSFRRRIIFNSLMTCFILLISYSVYSRYESMNKREVLVYNQYGGSTIIFNNYGHFTYLKNTSDNLKDYHYTKLNKLRYVPTKQGFIGDEMSFLSNILKVEEYEIQIIDKYFPKISSCPVVIVTDNIYPNDSDVYDLKKVIVDNSNKRSCIRMWEELCLNNDIEFINISESGSFLMPLK